MIDRAIAFGSARIVEAGQHRDAFKQGGFSRAIFPHNDGDGRLEFEFETVAQKGQAEWVSLDVRHARKLEPDAPQIRRWQADIVLAPVRHPDQRLSTGANRASISSRMEAGAAPMTSSL